MDDVKNENGLVQQPTQVVSAVEQMIRNEVGQAKTVDEAVELMVTHEALSDQETLDKIVEEKGAEQKNKYEAKRISAEVEKLEQEKRKQLAELDKTISAKQKEVEELQAESDKAQKFFEANKDILSCVGVRSKKTLKVMYGLMIPALIIFLIIQVIALPLTIGGKIIEMVVEIIAGICGAIASGALKIIIAILIALLLGGIVFCVYYFGGQLIL